MRPRRTPRSNIVFTSSAPGANEDSHLWAYQGRVGGPTGPVVTVSVWELTEADRAEIAAGANIALVLWSAEHPDVALHTTTEAFGRYPGRVQYIDAADADPDDIPIVGDD